MPIVKASKSVNASFSPEKKYQFGIFGRAPSVLGGNTQGDHVTAYALVEEGFYRVVKIIYNTSFI